MSNIIIGSARSDENGKLNGKAGDQKQKTKDDYNGEVSMQPFYIHSKGWFIIRPRTNAKKLAEAMIVACCNSNIGYSQAERLGVIKNGIHSATPTNADCSSLVRACIIDALGVDVGNFNTASEKTALLSSGQFELIGKYIDNKKTPLHVGDVIVTCTKGHTCIVCDAPENTEYFKKVDCNYGLVDSLKLIGCDSSMEYRRLIAKANGLEYTSDNSYSVNLKMLNLLREGLLLKP